MAERATRENETREKTSRKKQWQNPNQLLDPKPRPGLKHRWIRTSLRGRDDKKNVSSKVLEGWEPVAASEYDEFSEFANEDSGTIEYGGLVLCATDEEIVKQRNEYYQNKANAQLNSVDNNYLRENDPRMPLLPTERKSEFGSGGK